LTDKPFSIWGFRIRNPHLGSKQARKSHESRSKVTGKALCDSDRYYSWFEM